MDLIFLVTLAITPFLLGLSFGRYQRTWSRLKCLSISAGLLPGLIAVPCFLIVVMSMTTSQEHCGVDACGMALAAGMMGLIAAFFGFFVGLALAYAGFAIGRRRSSGLSDTFE